MNENPDYHLGVSTGLITAKAIVIDALLLQVTPEARNAIMCVSEKISASLKDWRESK